MERFLNYNCRSADDQRGDEQRGRWDQSGRDQGVREGVQVSQTVAGSDADPGRTGPERDGGASLQPKCHMQVSVRPWCRPSCVLLLF